MSCFSDPVWNSVFAGPAAWPRDAYLLQRDVDTTTVYVLDAGVIKLVYVTQSGDECVIDVRRAPTLIGWPFIVAKRPATLDVITLTNCTLRWCSAQTFLDALSDPVRSAELHRWHCAETLALWERAVGMSLPSSKQRLEHLLASHGVPEDDGDGLHRRLPFKQSLVASLISVTPEHLGRLLKRWSPSKGARAMRAESTAVEEMELRRRA